MWSKKDKSMSLHLEKLQLSYILITLYRGDRHTGSGRSEGKEQILCLYFRTKVKTKNWPLTEQEMTQPFTSVVSMHLFNLSFHSVTWLYLLLNDIMTACVCIMHFPNLVGSACIMCIWGLYLFDRLVGFKCTFCRSNDYNKMCLTLFLF